MTETRNPTSVKSAGISALWYAWGHIDAKLHEQGYTTDHGFEFSRLYEAVAVEYENGQRSSRMSVLDAWREFVRSKSEKGIDTALTVDDIDYHVRFERELAAETEDN